MRRRPLLLLAFASLVLALTLPGSALAAGDFKFRVLKDVCQANGGDFGRGHHRLKVRVEEMGKSGANKFTLDAKVLHRKPGSSKWTTEFSWERFKSVFPNDGDNYFHWRWFSYDPKNTGLHKIIVVIKIWHNRQLLASRTLSGDAC
jgi:hypothetical protein